MTPALRVPRKGRSVVAAERCGARELMHRAALDESP